MRLFPVIILLGALCYVALGSDTGTLRKGRPSKKPSSVSKTTKLPKNSQSNFRKAQKSANKKKKQRDHRESSIIKKHKYLSGDSSSRRHQSLMTAPKELGDKGRKASEIQDTTEYMRNKQTKDTDKTSISGTKLGRSACFKLPKCNFNSPYRTMDGSCNNILNPLVGMAGTPVIRFLPPAYSDKYGLQQPRVKSKTSILRKLSEDRKGRKKSKSKKKDKKKTSGGKSKSKNSSSGSNNGGNNNNGNNNNGNNNNGNNNGGNNNNGNNNGGNNNNGNNNGGNSQNELPSARLITSKIFSTLSSEMSDFTLMLMQWGQFIDHDLILTPTNTILGDNGETLNIDCCDNGQLISPSLLHPECFPIKIPADDPFYQPHGISCMNFVRSLPSANIGCTMGPREQMNAITHYLDASMIYGSSESEMEALRSSTQKWRLKTQDKDNLLPKAEDSEECSTTNGKSCFKAGDIRANEQTGLTVMHTLWMREHNRIADYLKAHLASTKTDDEIFQMTRKIVSAEVQHITYNEFLRQILGENYGNAHSLFPDYDNTYYTVYDENLDPSISNSFGAAAFRFGHSMVQGILKLFSKTTQYNVLLRTQFFNPFKIYEADFRDDMCRGLTQQPPQDVDGLFVADIMGHLFQGENENAGLDLPALNIQRGRDHGLPHYNAYRELCGLPRVTSFTELANGDPVLAARLREVYRHVDDVDLFVGGILELHHGDSLLGPTFLCIIGDQFYRLKNGDRYYYENNLQPNPFSEDQLWEIKNQVGLASIFCQNAEDFNEIPLNAFKSGNTIGYTPCDQIPIMDLSKFLTM